MSLRGIDAGRRRLVLPDLPPDTDAPARDPAKQAPAAVDVVAPARPPDASPPAAPSGALDSLLADLIDNAPAVPADLGRAAPPPAEASAPASSAAAPTSRPAARIPWRFAAGVAGAAAMAAVALLGARGLGARFAAPARYPDGSAVLARPASNADAWTAAAMAAGERVL